MSYDFEADDPFAFASAEDGIDVESTGDSGSLDEAHMLNNQGDVLAGEDNAFVKTFNEKNELTATYKCNAVTPVTGKTLVLGGAGTSGVVATQVSVSYSNTGPCTITITGHKHGTAAHNTPAFTVTLPSLGFGALDPLGNPASTDAQSASWSASIMNHVDKLNNQGTFLCGISAGCKIEASGEYLGAAPTLADGWIADGGDANTSNSDFHTYSLKAHQYQGRDTGA